MPAEQERAEMLQEFWDEGYGAEGDDEAYLGPGGKYRARFRAGANVGHRP